MSRAAAATMTRAALALGCLLAACGDDDGGTPDALAFDAAPPDAPAPACGLPAPGTRCADATRLERCAGTEVETVDCGAMDRTCGPDPGDPAGAACIADGDACGDIDFLGTCAGSVLAYCTGTDGLLVLDCAEVYAQCVDEGAGIGFNCVNACELEGASAEGECVDSSTLRLCEWTPTGFEVVMEDCPSGTRCGTVPETEWYGCYPTGDCADTGPQGRCAGDTLTRCLSGSSQNVDCAAGGQVCAFGGPDAGYLCAAPGTVGARSVSGVVRYEDRPATIDGLGPIAPRPARSVTIALVDDASGDVLAAALTADDGSFLLRHDAAEGASVHLLAAATSNSARRPLRVIRPDGRVHGFGGASFPVEAAATRDLLVTDASGESEAFNIFDQLVVGVDFLAAELSLSTLTPLYVVWVRGGADGTYWYPPGIFILGDPLDDDGYDDGVIVHELGHYLEDTYSRSDSPGGDHDGSPVDPRLAWSEGFATWFSGAARGDPVYVDSNAAGGWAFDADTAVTAANPAGGMEQDVSEDTVSEILWDTGDAPASDDDPMAGGAGHVLRAASVWFRSGVFADRGVAGVDLVDWLGGWFEEEGLTSCPSMRTVVGSRSFPYDFVTPAGTCP